MQDVSEQTHASKRRTQRAKAQRGEPQPKQTDVEAGKMPELSRECLSGE
jgi:hypothetical protein